MKSKGFLIAFEGIDCCGKHTQLCRTKTWLEELLEEPVAFSSEPNDESSPIGKRIRRVLKHEILMSDPWVLQRMFVIDRAQDVFVYINPVLEQGSPYLIERFALSTIAYGMLRWPLVDFIRLHNEVLGESMVWPDLNIIVDISAEEAIRRQAERSKNPPAELFENCETLVRVREHYHKIAQRSDVGNSAIIDGEQSPQKVFEDIKQAVTALFERRKDETVS